MSESLSVRFLYTTFIGRCMLKVLVKPSVSKAAGAFLDCGISRIFINKFKKSNNISLEGISIPEGGFKSFNDFFARKRAAECEVKSDLISPCDAFLSCIPISGDVIFDVKHTEFSLEEMLQSKELAEDFRDGTALIFRLTPAHYHRYCYAASGKVIANKKIEGILHCVRPIVTHKYPVYAQNAREYQVIETKDYGRIVQMEVGAIMVGRITNQEVTEGESVTTGREKGYFEFGGSTIILLLQKGIDVPAFEEEQPVKMGDAIVH